MSPSDEAFRAAAVRLYYKDGEVEIDPDAPVSRGGETGEVGAGAYVQAWVWVDETQVEVQDAL